MFTDDNQRWLKPSQNAKERKREEGKKEDKMGREINRETGERLQRER